MRSPVRAFIALCASLLSTSSDREFILICITIWLMFVSAAHQSWGIKDTVLVHLYILSTKYSA